MQLHSLCFGHCPALPTAHSFCLQLLHWTTTHIVQHAALDCGVLGLARGAGRKGAGSLAGQLAQLLVQVDSAVCKSCRWWGLRDSNFMGVCWCLQLASMHK